MLRCHDCRPLIPDLLYGLLDAPEAAAVEAHVASCPACAAASAADARGQGLIAEAARNTFPAVRFEAPAAKPRTPTTGRNPVAIPFPVAGPRDARPAANPPVPAGGAGTATKTRRAARFLPWAVAAAVLLAVPGTVVPVLRVLDRAELARRDAEVAGAKATSASDQLETARAAAAGARREADVNLAAARQAHDGLLAKWVADEKAAADFRARKVTWDVRKPASVQPGAPNEFLVVVRDRGAAPGGRVVAEFRDQTDAVVYSHPLDHEKRAEHTVRLPAAAWAGLKPDSELFLVVTREDEKTREKTVLQDRVRLLGPVFATVLTTDRPTYRPGDTVFFRSLTLDRTTFTPPAREQFLHYELRGPNGAVVRAGKSAGVEGGTDLVRVVEGKATQVLGPDGKPVRGVGTGAFALPPDAPDGDYTLVLHEAPHPAGGLPVVPFPVARAVKVRSAAAEAYHKLTGYAAASYSAGETVEAWAELKFKEQPVAGAEVRAVAVADDQVLDVVQVQPPVTGENGKARLRFTLPPNLERGDVRLKVTFRARNGRDVVEETVADRVPVVGRNLLVEFFPEGGDLVAGVRCRVYVRATTPAGHPVEIAGTVTDGRRTLAAVRTASDPNEPGVNRGIGSFEFVPELGTPMWLKLDSPAGAYSPILVPANGRFPVAAASIAGVPSVAASRTGFPLPEVKAEGVVMTVPTAVTRPGEPIRVRLHSVARPRTLVVGAYTRGRLSDTKRLTVEPGRPGEVELMAGTDPRGGVVRVTAFEEPEGAEKFDGDADRPRPDLKPVAERLVFRRPGEALNLNFATSGKPAGAAGFAPGSAVRLDVTATDEKGNPAAAVLYAAVVNTAVAPGPKDRLLPTHFLLAGEVNTPDALEYADFLLTDGEAAADALDRVLATQGWRRFAEQTPEGFARQPVAATAEQANLLVCNGQYLTAGEPGWAREIRGVRDRYWPLYEAAAKNLDRAKAAAERAAADRTAAERAEKLAAVVSEARAEAGLAANRAADAGAAVERFRGVGWYAVGGFWLLALGLGAGCLAARTARLPLGIGTAGAVGIASFLVVTLGSVERTHAAGHASRDAAPDAPAAQMTAAAPAVAPPPRAGESGAAFPPPPADRAPEKGGFGEAQALGGSGIVGNLPGAPVVVTPPVRSKGGQKADAKGVAIAPPTGPAAPQDPNAAGMPARVTGAAGGTGWKPYRGENMIPNELLPREAEVRRLRDTNADKTTTFGMVKLNPTADVPAPPAPGGVPTAKADALADGMRRGGTEHGEAYRPALPPLPPAIAGLLKSREVAAPVPPLVVREYASPRPGSDERKDRAAADTILWHPVVVLPSDGKVGLDFRLGDAPGGYQVTVAGHTLDGRLGAVRGVIPVAAPTPPASNPPAVPVKP